MSKSLRELQLRLPWTIKYSRDFRANPQTHKDFGHAVVHATKAIGRLASLVDDMDHDMDVALTPSLQQNYEKYLADLVICAIRMANTFPGKMIDLEKAVVERIESKNEVKLWNEK